MRFVIVKVESVVSKVQTFSEAQALKAHFEHKHGKRYFIFQEVGKWRLVKDKGVIKGGGGT